MTLSRTFEINDITPEEAAAIFAAMSDYEQAQFFAAVYCIAATWPGAGWCQQSCSIAQRLDDRGRFVIQKLAEHADLISEGQPA